MNRFAVLTMVAAAPTLATASRGALAVSETVDALLGDMLAWLARDARPYSDVMEAWRTSCPRLPVWEEATGNGYVAQKGNRVELTDHGRAFLAQRL
jgi:D-3-phosphoglycerate dehydrogenase